MRPLRTLGYYAAHAALSVVVLAVLPPIRDVPLRVPITYERDGLFLTILAKTIHEDGFRHATRIGAPFGTDLVDWPLGMWLPFAQLAGLTGLLGEPGTAINVYWMSTIVLAGVCAAYAFRRLRLGPGLAFVLGTLYAFQPYAFYRNVEHANLAFPFVPLLALLCLRVAGTGPEETTTSERRLTLAACVAQGFSYVYYSVFACALLVFAAPLGWLRTRRARPVLRALGAITLLAACSATMLLPTTLYWHRHGYNPDLDYKPPAETDTYGLKLRHLLLPIAEHPLPPLRALAWKVEAIDFPGDNENQLSKLASVGSVGLLALLALVVGRTAGAWREVDGRLQGAAALLFASLLLANVGGLASLFSVFVSSDVRCWGRIVVFLSFFCLLAAGTLLSRLSERLPARWRTRPFAAGALALLLVGGLFDQIPVARLAALRQDTAAAFDEEGGLVRTVEDELPAGAMVFQLPQMTVPIDRVSYPPMLYYDPGRMFVHSRTLRWSWGAMIERHHDWGRAVDALPLPEKVRTLALAGFSGIWIDRWGYDGVHRPRFADLERDLSALLGASARTSSRDRYSFFSLVSYRRSLEATLGPERAAQLRRELLADMPISRWREGCGEERPGADGWWRTCGRTATLELRNWRPGAIRVTFRARLRGVTSPLALSLAGPGFEDHVELAPDARPYARVFDVDGTDNRPPRLTAPRSEIVTLRVDGPAACAPTGCFEIGDVSIATRRLIGGVPVNADGGVAVRTKY